MLTADGFVAPVQVSGRVLINLSKFQTAFCVVSDSTEHSCGETGDRREANRISSSRCLQLLYA